MRDQDYQACLWVELIEFWRLYNLHLAHVIRRIPDEKLQMECRVGTNDPGTLGDLIDHYLTHLRHHLDQIQERQRS